jgi:hypothetical protein
MGLFGHGDAEDGESSRRFQMREKMMSIGDDYWIEDASGHRAYKVDGKALHFRDTFILEDAGQDGDRATGRRRHRPEEAARDQGSLQDRD